MRRVTVSFLIAVVLSIVSCGSSGNAKDGGVDAPLDREARSESSLEDAREDGGAPPVDAGSDVGPESSSPSCAGMAAGKCAGCCIASFGDGHTVFLDAELSCACASAKLCGPLEAGAADAGGKKLGLGACTSYCPGGTGKPPVSVDCKDCVLDAYGTMVKPGDCFEQVDTTCKSSAACMAYQACLAACG
jgi:hypothetical protein